MAALAPAPRTRTSTAYSPTAVRRPTRRTGRVLALAFGLTAILMATLSPALTYGWTNYTFSSTAEDKIFTLINQARASAGLGSVSRNTALDSVARWRSKDMWDRNYFSHTIPSPPGGNVFDELKRRGICYTVAGEIIAVNNYPDDQTVQVAFNGWMNSSGHRDIILGSGFNRVGVGAFKGNNPSDYPKKYYTAVFTHGCTSTATPTPKPTVKPTATPKPTVRPTATPKPTVRPTATPKPTVRPTATPKPTVRPTATPKPTPKPTPRPTATDNADPTVAPEPTPEVTAGPTPDVTAEPTPEVTAEPFDPVADINQPWIDLLLDDGYSGIGVDGPVDVPTPAPDVETAPPTAAPSNTGPPGGDGTLQVIEPPPSAGLVDTIVGDVVASFLGK